MNSRRTALLCTLLVLFATAHAEDTVRIAVAANFKSTLDSLTEQYSSARPTHFVISAASSGALYAQIHEGAPYDLFLSADSERPAQLERDKLTIPGTRVTYAVGQLVLWTPGRKVAADIRQTLRPKEIRSLALANPATAPYGAAAEQVLKRLNLAARFKLLRGENIGQTFQFLATRNADAGFIARSQVLDYERANSRSLAEETLVVDPSLHTPISQDAVLLKSALHNSAAQAFLQFLLSPEAQTTIRNAGYTTPAQPANPVFPFASVLK